MSSGDTGSIISPRLVTGLVLVSALSALAFLALSAYAPDLRSDLSDGGTAISKSAIGFAGLRVLLEAEQVGVSVGREPPTAGQFSLVILTPEMQTEPKEIRSLSRGGARLIVLPKWIVSQDPLHAGWVRKIATYDGSSIANLLSLIAKAAKLGQRSGVAKISFKGAYAQVLPAKTLSIDALQTISGPDLDPELVDDKGNAVLAEIHGTQTFILADPDLLNNAGLRDASAAHDAFDLIQALRAGDAPVSLDVTLNGFRRSRQLLRTVFSPPFLGATLCAILAAAFLGYHAMSRFGSPIRPDRVFGFGKRALVDNIAQVIRMMRREPAMAPRYAQAMLSEVAGFFGISREKAADPAVIRALEQRSDVPHRFADLRAEAADVRNTDDLVQVAGKLYRWRRGITHGHL